MKKKEQKKRSKKFAKKFNYYEDTPIKIYHVNPECPGKNCDGVHGEIPIVKTIVTSHRYAAHVNLEKITRNANKNAWIRAIIISIIFGIIIGLSIIN